MKRIFSCLVIVFIIFCSFCSFSGCSKNEIEKVSKNLTTYAINVNVNDEEKTLSATQCVKIINNFGDSLSFACFHLYPRAFREGALIKPYTQLTEASCFPDGVGYGDIIIKKVFVNDKVSNFQLVGQDEDVLKVDFGFVLMPKDIVDVDIEFDLIIPKSTHRLGFFKENINLGNWYPILCAYKNGEFNLTPYYSTGDPFCSDVANYEVSIKFPKKYSLSSTGNLSIIEKETSKTATITARAVRDFAMVFSSNSNIETLKADNVSISYMSCFEKEKILKVLDIAKDVIEFFSKIFGTYAYDSLMIATTPFLYGGMEYPNLIFISDSIDSDEEFYKVLVHEIAHQWWYGIVGNNELEEAWLDESLAEYSAALFFEAYPKYGINYEDFVKQANSSYMLYVDVISTIRGDVNTKMNLAVNQYQNDYEYSYMVYIKGVIMFDSLRIMVGKDRVVAGLKKYFDNNKYKIATKENFYDAFNSACHKDLKGFFDGFLDGTTIISNIN